MHSTYVHATNSLPHRGADSGLYNGKGNEAKVVVDSQMYSLWETGPR